MILHRGSRKARRVVFSASIELLEQRQLLTTLHGGQTLEFIDQAGLTDRAVAFGQGSDQWELIGANFEPDATQQFGQGAILHDISGNLINADGTTQDVLGGLGAAHSVFPIGTVTGAAESFTDIVNGPTPLQHPSGGININALSSDSTGRTYGLNIINRTSPAGTQRLVELLSINYRNVTANGVGPADAHFEQDLAPQIVALTGATDPTKINSIIGMDFLPSDDNILYIGVNVSVPRPTTTSFTPTDASIPFLLKYDFTKPANQRLELLNNPTQTSEFISDQANAGFSDVAPTVQGLTFTSNDRLVAFVTGRAVGGTGDATGIGTATGLVELNPDAPFFDLNAVTPVRDTTGKPVTALTSLEVIPGDDDFVYGISGTNGGGGTTGGGVQGDLFHVQRVGANAGVAQDYGPLDYNDANNTKATLGDLDWNPVLQGNFTPGRKGVLIAEDTAIDQLDVIDSRTRYPTTNLYAVYGTRTTAASSFSVAQVPAVTVNVRPMQLFTGSPGPIQIHPAQGGVDIEVTPGNGSVFIGARTLNIDPTTTAEQDRPIRRILKKPSQAFGLVPKTTKYIYAGLHINGDVHNVLIGGTVTGNVTVNGSANLLYAGDWLTGDPNGILQTAALKDPATDLIGNVYVQGDLREFASLSAIGSDSATTAPGATDFSSPRYLTGFNMAVGGNLGEVRTPSAIFGNISVSGTFVGSSEQQTEVEDNRGPETGATTYAQGFLPGDPPTLGGTRAFDNNTFATAEYLGTAQNNALGNDQSIVVNGQIEQATNLNDANDYYRVSLMAGQTVSVQLSAIAPGAAVGVFDPDGRLIDSDRFLNNRASDISDFGALRNTTLNQPFQFTADRPGDYRFAVGEVDDAQFNDLDEVGAAIGFSAITYTLTITGVGDLALGGVHAGAQLLTYESGLPGIRVHSGDLGGVASDLFVIDRGDTDLPYSVDHGNLRSIDAPSIGRVTPNNTFTDGVNFLVPRGSVGLIRGTDAGGIVFINPLFDSIGGVDSAVLDPFTPNPAVAVGEDFELVDAAGSMTGVVSADRAIGTIRAGTFNTTLAPYFIANADHKGSDGTIDLIDTPGQLGILGVGGPHILTGPGGNVRYIHVLGAVFKPSTFGGTQDTPSVLAPGQTIRLIDDSGTAYKLSPTPLVKNTAKTLPTDPDFLNPGNLSVLTYPVDDHKAGVVLVNVTVDSNPGNVANHGLEVDTGAVGTNGSVEIGSITMLDAGRTVTETTDPTTGLPLLRAPAQPTEPILTAPDTTSPVNILLTGKSTIDAWSITGQRIDSIENDTDGEIVNISALSVADISAEWIGIAAHSHTGVDPSHSGNAVNGFTVQNDQGDVAAGATPLTPFVGQRNLIDIAGQAGNSYLVSARARKGIGNILVAGIIGNITADSNDHKDPGGGFEGIDGPIVATATASDTSARIMSVDVGRGLEFGGRGDVPRSGIFAGDAIQSVTATNADIRGTISVGGGPPPLSNPVDGLTLDNLSLKNGSLIGAFVGETSNFNDWRANAAGPIVPENGNDDPNDNPHFEIGSINLKGNGGIIGTLIIGADIGPININGGFGFLSSSVLSVGDNLFQGITTTGYGIRDSFITGMGTVNELDAEGNGNRLDARSFDPGVQYGANGPDTVDPNFGAAPSEFTDLYRNLGLTAKKPKKKSISSSGVIQDLDVQLSSNLNDVQAYQIRHRNSLESMIFNVANQVGSVDVSDGVDGLTLNTGGLKEFSAGADVAASSIGVSGPIKTFSVGGTLRGTSEVTATGPEGSISSIQAGHGIFADINADVSIGSIIAGGDLGSENISTINNIDLIQVGGSILGSTTIAFIKDKQISPFKKITKLVVTHNVEAGATIRVLKLVEQHIGGVVNGDIIVGPKGK
jgi:hypothetical protein